MSDFAVRSQALDPHQSFIVQAPAGSGKTELLTQRFLVLLARAEKNPEEILAITFTKKAASEMRARVMKALICAATKPEPQQDHEKKTWQLARAVYERSETLQWHLLDNPNRLRIQTIDSFCYSLARQMPVVSGLGNIEIILDHPEELYEKTVENLFDTLDDACSWRNALRNIILHLNNDLNKVKKLFVEMLANRDQWLPHFTAIYPHLSNEAKLNQALDKLKIQLENGLIHLVTENIHLLEKKMGSSVKNELEELLAFSLAQLNQTLEEEDKPVAWQLARWKRFGKLLVTDEFTWRKSLDKRLGFPAPSNAANEEEKRLFTQMKSRLQQLIAELQQDDALRARLQSVCELPHPEYLPEQWQLIEDLLRVLPVLAAQLNLLFHSSGCVDFIHISGCALTALENFDSPTDLALRLDHQIRHILVDEFQDTSYIQYSLLEKLTQGWEHQDGRTLFLVGDPMQSIYRFRMAEVGIFLQVCQSGLGALTLTPLKLKLNFRSTPQIIDSINTHFTKLFPARENIATGEIPYHRSSSFHPEHAQSKLYCHFTPDREELTHSLIDSIQYYHEQHPNDSMAILVRKRTDIQKILPVLKQQGIHYSAVELEQLHERPVILDLLALARALLHLGDRIAWLAILRAPWCGLTLADLYVIGKTKDALILESLQLPEIMAELSSDGQQRVQSFLSVILVQLEKKGRLSLRLWVEETFVNLHGPRCLQSATEFEEAQLFLTTLDDFSQKSALFDIQRFETQLKRKYVNGEKKGRTSLQIMTIHKSKGLEFDAVFLWGLERKPRNTDKSLLAWTERFRLDNTRDLLLAPMTSHANITDPIYDYIANQNIQKDRQESKRLFYVAATRAKKNLHLFGRLKVNDEGAIKKPEYNSLLNYLFESSPELFSLTNAFNPPEEVEENELTLSPSYIARLSRPHLPGIKLFHDEQKNQPISHLTTLTDDSPRLMGIVVHRYLKSMVDLGYLQAPSEASIRATLLMEGIRHDKLKQSIQTVNQAIQHLLADPKAQWILNTDHLDSQAEYPLTCAIAPHQAQRYVIDRTFIDKGVRWIIDYKMTETIELADPEAILEKYQAQLENYAKIFAAMEDKPIKLGLYFPLTQQWVEWEY